MQDRVQLFADRVVDRCNVAVERATARVWMVRELDDVRAKPRAQRLRSRQIGKFRGTSRNRTVMGPEVGAGKNAVTQRPCPGFRVGSIRGREGDLVHLLTRRAREPKLPLLRPEKQARSRLIPLRDPGDQPHAGREFLHLEPRTQKSDRVVRTRPAGYLLDLDLRLAQWIAGFHLLTGQLV
jgi:hypothetical protein